MLAKQSVGKINFYMLSSNSIHAKPPRRTVDFFILSLISSLRMVKSGDEVRLVIDTDCFENHRDATATESHTVRTSLVDIDAIRDLNIERYH
jgi:hypothetical protein